MNDLISVEIAKSIMGDNFIGPEELLEVGMMNLLVPASIPLVPFSKDELLKKKDDYLLIMGVSKFANGKDVTIRNLISIFGKETDGSLPCFYNQDWYEKEDFIDVPMNETWYLIRKYVYEDSRAVLPQELSSKYVFPSAVKCVYSFFISWLVLNTKLWYTDFIWCNDFDHNGDQIYVGKYHDVDGINKDGFSIHRHLALRKCYGCID